MAEAAVAVEAGDKFRRELVLLLDTTALQHVVPSGADDGNGEKITQTQRSKDRMRNNKMHIFCKAKCKWKFKCDMDGLPQTKVRKKLLKNRRNMLLWWAGSESSDQQVSNWGSMADLAGLIMPLVKLTFIRCLLLTIAWPPLVTSSACPDFEIADNKCECEPHGARYEIMCPDR